jgi:predicted Zn finger-like uncharacterized protein
MYEINYSGIRKADTNAATRWACHFSRDCLKKETCLMVIECISCSRKFNLNESLLKPAGSRVRCSKCGTIFHAYPAHNANSLNPTLETDAITEDADQGESATSGFEKRKHAGCQYQSQCSAMPLTLKESLVTYT